MAQIDLSLSSKTQKDTGKREILIRFFNGSKFNLRAKSEVFVNPDFFEYYVDRSKTAKLGVNVPNNVITTTIAKAEKCGYVLRTSGEIVINKRINTPEVNYHKEQGKRIESMKTAILDNFAVADKDSITGDWLKSVVEKINHPEKADKKQAEKATFYQLAEEYLTKKQFSNDHTRAIRVLIRDVARYEGFIRATENKTFTFDVDKVTRNDIEDFLDYLRNEYQLAKEYPTIFKKLVKNYPVGVAKGRKQFEVRGDNTIIKLTKKLKAFFVWLYESDKTNNRPFEGIKIGAEKFGTPYYITIEERNLIATTDLQAKYNALTDEEKQGIELPISTIETQRDIFVFQCLIGCRVGDLITMTEKNIENGVLVYTPHKTKDEEDSLQARVPLHDKAIELINKYRGKDSKGRLFPFITPQKYNVAIKAIFTLSGITRNVEVRNAKTGENEIKPINEIASSHLARRTFVGNAYFKVNDPNLIGKMSGHVEGSRAFARYRKIEDSTLKDIINLIG